MSNEGVNESSAELYLEDSGDYEDFDWKKLMIARAQVYATLAVAQRQKETNDILRSFKEHNFLTYKAGGRDR